MKHYYDIVANKSNVLVAGATVSVFVSGTQTLANIFSDDGVTPKVNPTITDTKGRFDFFIADGRYDIQASGATISTETQRNVEISDVTETTLNDANWSTQLLNVAGLSTPPGTPTAGLMSVYSKAAPKHLFVKDDQGNETDLFTAVGSGAQPPLGSLQYDNSGGLGGSQFIYTALNPGTFPCLGNCASVTTTANSGLGLSSTDGKQFIVMSAENGTGCQGQINSQVTSPQSNAFGYSTIVQVGGNTGTGFCSLSGTSVPCSLSFFAQTGDIASDTQNGQEITGFGSLTLLNKSAGHSVGNVGNFVVYTPLSNNPVYSGALGAPLETASKLWGLEVQDLKGLGTAGTVGVHIERQTNPGPNNFAIRAEVGAGPSQLDSFLTINPSNFAGLGTPVNGTITYCSDCSLTTPCTGGGTGAFATRLNGQWTCNASSGVTGVTNFSFSETGIDALMAGTVTNPTTTPNLNITANPTQPGMVLAGPISTGSATNPTFENSNVAASLVNGTTVSVSATPAAVTTAAIFFGTTGLGQNVPVPDGTWTSFPSTAGTIAGSLPRFKNIASTATLTTTSTITNSDSWSASLAFLGGSITSTPQAAAFSNTGTGQASATMGAVTAGHTIVIYGTWASGTVTPRDIRATDNLGNTYSLMLVAPFPNTNPQGGHFALIAQNVASGGPTIKLTTSTLINFGSTVAFDLAGPGPYFSGPVGPWQFRYLNSGDLAAAGVGVLQSAISTTTTCPTSSAAGSTCTYTVAWPTPFADTNYSVSCTGGGTITGFPGVQGFTSKTANGVTIVVENGTANEAVASGYSEMDCIARHP